MDLPVLQMTVAGTAEAVRHALRDILADKIFAPYSADLAINAEIALAETLNNIVEHAYAHTSGDIQIMLLGRDSGLVCRLADRGAAMPGLCLPEGAFQTPGEITDLPEGGFGWFLIRSLVQDLRYARVNDENQLSFLLVDKQSAVC